MADRSRVVAAHPDTSLEVESFGSRASIRHELHLPLLVGANGEELLGIVSLGRTQAVAFTADELDLVAHLVDTSSVALYNAVVSNQREQAGATLRAVFDSVGECILVISPDRELLIANPPMDALARKIMGIGPDAPWDISDLSVGFRRESSDPDAMEAQARQLADDPFTRNRAEIELPRFGMFLQRYTAPVVVGDEVIARIVVIRDATEERQAERAKDDLMSTVSHELRTPLAAILGFTELLTSRAFSPEEQEEYLMTVHEQSVRLASLVDDFLDLQRLEARGLDANEPFDLRPLIVDTVQFYGAQSASHHLFYDGTTDPLRVTGDADHLRRVLSNLLSNAIKYSPGGGDVRVEAETDGDRVRVAVVDRGVGIPAAQRARVFERFFRVDAPDRHGIHGTGLGLALVRDIVQAHGGEVGVDSVEGEGSRFWVTLPVAI